MNENSKTGIFWGVAVVMLAIALFVAWPAPQRTEDSLIVGRPLFQDFQDPLAAANMRIVNFDEVLGQLDTFEVRKDRETGRWTIPSRQGYPADAVEQMRDAANSLTGLTILDVQSANAEDHDDLGVVEPKLEDLEVGDEGVGRLVTFKDESQKTLASLIIGKPVEGEEEKIYVRKPGQDPVYVVRLDDSPLTTRFRDWIEKDLLQLSSIDIAQVEVKDYNAALGLNRVSLTRNYSAKLSVDGTDWTVDEILIYDPENPLADPEKAPVDPDAVPNAAKLNALKDALDDLEIVDVARKPDGLSANLKADKELVSDNEAITSLAQRGFIPLELGPEGETEVISANGELAVTLRDGVRYILRFGNAAGLTEDDGDDEDDEQPVSGINRYLLVTTEVDESRFPTPDLRSVPETLDELEAMLRGDEAEPEPDPESASPEPDDSEPDDSKSEEAKSDESEPDEATTNDSDEATESPADSPQEPAESPADESSDEETPADSDVDEIPSDDEGPEAESNGDGKSNGDGEDESADESESSDDGDDGDRESSGESDEPKEDAADEPKDDESDTTDESEPTDEPKDEESEPTDTEPAEKDSTPSELAGLTEEEKLERLEAEQEKITKENQRKLDERNDRIETARRRVRELNFRFADWYYVIPESTYQNLRIRRSELFAEATQDDTDSAPSTPIDLPNFNTPAPGSAELNEAPSDN